MTNFDGINFLEVVTQYVNYATLRLSMTNIKTDTKNRKAINPESVTINESSAALFHYNIPGDGRLLDGF